MKALLCWQADKDLRVLRRAKHLRANRNLVCRTRQRVKISASTLSAVCNRLIYVNLPAVRPLLLGWPPLALKHKFLARSLGCQSQMLDVALSPNLRVNVTMHPPCAQDKVILAPVVWEELCDCNADYADDYDVAPKWRREPCVYPDQYRVSIYLRL